MYDIRVHFDLVNKLEDGDPKDRIVDDLWNKTPYYTVKRVVFHPMYDHHNYHYNIAVIELNSAVTGGNYPIKLAKAGGS